MSDDEKEFDEGGEFDPEGDEEEEEGEEEGFDGEEMQRYAASSRAAAPQKKRSRPDVTSFFDIEAEEDEEDEEEEEEEGEADFIDHQNEVADMSLSTYRQRGPDFLNNELTQEELEERFRDYPEFEGNTELRKQSTLPTARDTKLWMVKCKYGKERLTAISMMQKYYATKNTPDRLLIKSVLAPDHLKGCIYIEAEKEPHVSQAIKGMRNLQQYGHELVPIKDMVDVLGTSKKSSGLKKGDWIRIKRGLYSGDLAQIFDYEEARGKVVVKLIPRIEYNPRNEPEKPKEKTGDKAEKDKSKLKTPRPPPKFFNKEEAQQYATTEHPLITRNDGTHVWKGNRFKDGYLLKAMNIKSINFVGVAPTLEELQKFQSPAKEKRTDDEDGIERDEDRPLLPIPQLKKIKFSKGDTVKVVEGELKNLMGVVESVDGDTITMMPKHELLKDLLRIPSSQLEKFFKVGDHVKVISGRYEGETGFVMNTEGNTATLFSDLSNSHIKVLIQDIQECAEVATGKMQLGNYELHDLIQINQLTVGMIVKIERDTFRVLDNNGVIQTIALQQAGRKINIRDGSTFDAHSNTISVGDSVQVIDGPFKGKQGTIQRIYKYFAFLQSKTVLENGGIFVVRTGNCALVGVSAKKKVPSATPSLVPQSPRHYTQGGGASQPARGFSSPSGGSRGGGMGGGGRGGGGGNRRRNENPIVGKVVTIKTGTYKGYIGIVKSATKTHALVELHTSCKTVTIPLENLAEKNAPTEMQPRGGRLSFAEMRTPSHASEEGFQTPMRTMNTPLRPSTPVHGTAWDPSMPNTPRHNSSSWDPSGDSSWSSGGWGDSGSIATPGGFTPYSPGRPGLGDQQPNTPSDITPNAFTPSGFTDRTPSHNIGTPATMDTPDITTPGQDSTPGTEMSEEPLVDKEWQTPDILVRVTDGPYINAEGVIKDVLPNTCHVFLNSTRETVSLPHNQLEPVPPAKKNVPVKIIRGPLKGKKGTLYGIEGGEAIVKMSTDLDIKILELNHLAVFVED